MIKILMIFLVASFSLMAQENKIKDFFKDKTDIPSPLELRDPFKAPKVRGATAVRPPTGGKLIDGVFTNLPGFQNLRIDEIAIKGVFFGSNRRAVAVKIGKDGKQVGKDTFIIKEGMKLGRTKAEVKAILPGGIVIVEKIVNVYGQEEYLETIIPISNL